MLARSYVSADARGLDLLLGHNKAGDVQLNQDEIIVTGEIGRPSGVLVFRPGAFVHELQCGQNLLRANVLANFAIGRATAKELRTAVFTVRKNNAAMIRFVCSLGAIQQGDDELVFTLTP